MKVNLPTQVSSRPGLDSAILTGSSWIGQLVSAVILILCARELSYEQFAALASTLAIAAVIVAGVDFGTNSLWFVRLSSGTLSLAEWRNLAGAKFAIGFLLLILLGAASLILGPICIQIGLVFFFQLVQQTLFVFHKVTDQNRAVAASAVLDRLLALGLVSFWAFLGIDFGDYAYLPFVIGSLLACILLFLLIQKGYRPSLPFNKLLKDYASGSRDFGIQSLVGAFRGADVYATLILAGSTQSSLYSAVSKWNMPIVIAGSALSTVAIPLLASRGFNRADLKVLKVPLGIFFGVILLSLVVAIQSELAVSILLGPMYADSSEILRFCMIAGALFAMTFVLGAALQAVGRQKKVALISVLSFVIQFVLVFIMTPFFGALGTVLSMCISQLISLIVLLVCFISQMNKLKFVNDAASQSVDQ